MRALMLLFCLLCSGRTMADARTVSSGTVSLVQVKNETVEVPAKIEGVTGSVDLKAGTGTLTIPVSAWSSGVEIRDTNVRGTFFSAMQHPTATFTLESLTPIDGSDGQHTAKGTLTLYAGSVPVEARVGVTQASDGITKIETNEPFTVTISSLDLGEALSALKTLCAHQSVADEVKVGVSLTLATP